MNSPVSAIEAIEKAMEGVTPGPWSFQYTDESGECFIISENLGGLVGAALPWPTEIDDRDFRRVISNARYIAACNPVAMREVLALARQAEALQRENAELREALKPFADVARYFGHLGDDNGSVMVNIYLGSLRRARALLGGSENAGN